MSGLLFGTYVARYGSVVRASDAQAGRAEPIRGLTRATASSRFPDHLGRLPHLQLFGKGVLPCRAHCYIQKAPWLVVHQSSDLLR